MPLSDATKQRVRAALVLGGYERVEDLAAALDERDSGITLRRLRTIWQKGESSGSERREIAAACGIPAWFMEQGFEGAPAEAEEPKLAERVEALESQMDTVLRVLTIRVGESLAGGASPPAGRAGSEGG